MIAEIGFACFCATMPLIYNLQAAAQMCLTKTVIFEPMDYHRPDIKALKADIS